MTPSFFFTRALVGLALCSLAPSASAAPLPASQSALRVRADTAAARQRLGQRFDHVYRDLDSGELILEADQDDYDWLRAQGFKPSLDAARTAALAQNELGMAKAIPGFDCYPTVTETYALIDTLVATYPSLASKIDIGDSWEKGDVGGNPGFDIFVLKISNAAIVEDKPKFFVMSAVHAREYATAPVNTAFGQWLLSNYGNDPDATWLVDHNEFHLLLQANPDGRLFAETGQSQRKNRHDQGQGSGTARGVDLNRNYPFGWGFYGNSSGTFSSEIYRGLSAGSEPENQSVVAYINSIFPDRRPGAPSTGDLTTPAAADTQGLFFDVHSVANLVLWPWGMTGTPGNPITGNNAALRSLGRRLAWFNQYFPEQSNDLPADGASDDNAYASLGVPAYTIELGSNSFFQDCATFNSSILPDNLAMLRYAARTLHAPYQLPSGPEIRNATATVGPITQGDPVTLGALADDSHFEQTNGTEPTQTISAVAASIDVLPWDPAAILIPLAASDGSFNSSAENVSVTFSSAGLSLGRHLVYLQATDASGANGPPSTVFLDVIAPLFASGFE